MVAESSSEHLGGIEEITFDPALVWSIVELLDASLRGYEINGRLLDPRIPLVSIANLCVNRSNRYCPTKCLHTNHFSIVYTKKFLIACCFTPRSF
jgi:hypothetical protein